MFLFLFLFFPMLFPSSFFRLKELYQGKHGLTMGRVFFFFFLKMPKIWVGRTTLNGEKKRVWPKHKPIDQCYSCVLSVTEGSLQLKKTCLKMYLSFWRETLIRSRNADLGVILFHNYEFQLHPSGSASCYLNLVNLTERTFLSLRHICKTKKKL